MPPDYFDRLQQIGARQDRYITAIVSGFERRLAATVAQAQSRMLVTLNERLRLTSEGRVDPTSGNMQVLRSLDDLFQRYMNDAGHQELVTAFVGQFDGQLPFFQEVLEAMSETMETPLPRISWNARDVKAFSSMQVGAGVNLEAIIETAGNNAMRQALLSVGGLPYRKLVAVLSETLSRSVVESSTIGATAMATYYRTVADRGYQIIEEDLPELEIRYAYFGPLDNLIRPFCRRLMVRARQGGTWTRQQIAGMNNGNSLGNVLVNGGGYNCRHQWAPVAQERKQPRSALPAGAVPVGA